MKGKLSTKAIVLIVLAIVLIAIAATGTVLFLKDSGKAEAMSEENLTETLPVAGTDEEEQTATNVQTEQETESQETATTESTQTEQVAQNTRTSATTTTTQTSNNSTTTTAVTNNQTANEPAPTTVERERVVSEETIMSWEGLNIAEESTNFDKKGIDYNNLRYTVNYFEDGVLVATEVIKGNKIGTVVTEVESQIKDEYHLDEENSTKLPFIVTENDANNVINVFYLINKYNINFIADENGTLEGTTDFVISSGTEFGSITLPETKANEGYCFDKWDPMLPEAGSKVLEDATYKAIFAIDENGNNIPDYRDTYYTVKFISDENGTLEGTTEFSVLTGLEFGSKVTVPETKANEGYCFDKWEPVLPEANSKVLEDATYKAIFATDENGNNIPDYRDTYYTVKFISDENGTLEGTTEFSVLTGLEFGSKVTVPETKANEGYCFDKWEPVLPEANSKVTADAEYKAIFATDENGNNIPDYRDTYYTVKFISDENGTLEGTTEFSVLTGLEFGSKVTVPETKANEGYVFDKWEPVLPEADSKVTADAEYKAIFKLGEYNYSVEYYYDGIKDENKTFYNTATYGETISTYPDKCITGYKLEKDVEPIVIKTTGNIMSVYYVKDSFAYTIEYYKDTLDSEKIATKGETESYKQLYKTVLTQEIVASDAGENWINEFKPEGYTDGTVTYTTIEIENNVVKVLYTPRTDLSYTVRYFYNDEEDTNLTETYNNQTFGATLTYIDKAEKDGEVWEKYNVIKPSETIIADNLEIKVYYGKAVITGTKTVTDGTQNITETSKNKTIKYNINVFNSGKVAGTVNVTDLIPENTNYVEGSITENGTINNDKTQITWSEVSVPADGSITLSFMVTIDENCLIGSKINNTATIKDVDDNIITEPTADEVTVTENAKVTVENKVVIDKTNVVLLLDISSSMNDKINGVRKIDSAKNTMKSFVNKLYSTNADEPAKLSIVVFAGGAFDSEKDLKVLTFANGTTVSSDKTEITNAINSISVPSRFGGTATCIGRALEETYYTVKNLKNLYPSNKNLVIFLGDGEPTGPGNGSIESNANNIKNELGAKLYTIAFNMGDSQTLKDISSGNGYYYTAENESDLTNNYSTILTTEGTEAEETVKSNSEGKIVINLNGNTVKYPIILNINGTDTQYTSSNLPSNLIVTGTQIIWDVSSYNVGTTLELKYSVN